MISLLKDFGFYVTICLLLWACFSAVGSSIKVEESNCGKVYPIDSVLWTNAFCVLEEEDNAK